MSSDCLFEAASACLEARDADEKVELTNQARRAWTEGRLDARADARPPGDCTAGLPPGLRLVGPLEVPRRRLSSAEGQAAFVHAITHIELNAVNLAWDCVYRFRGLPRAYYDDWTCVADDEARHFGLLRARLRELGAEYGDFAAHNGLWEMAEKTAHDVVARMAMVPRVLEARGLDVTPGMIRRLRRRGDHRTADVLDVILEEEVAHVAAGSRWFRHACHERGEDPEQTFPRLVSAYMNGRIKGPLNTADRRRAGFSERELAALGEMQD